MSFDKSQFIDGFKTEVKDHLKELNSGFLKLEKQSEVLELIETLSCEAHTIKGVI